MTSTVLVVDDYEGVTHLCREALTRGGYRVDVATRGLEAVDLARRNRPDLILMDVELPDLDGLSAAYMLRSCPDTRGIPILAMSGTTDSNLREEATRLGCLGLLSKPFSLGKLMRQIEEILFPNGGR